MWLCLCACVVASMAFPSHALSVPSAECRAAAQTDNIIRCLSRAGHFQDTLAQIDFCAQTRLVYTCFNKTCCLQNRAYDIERDSSLATCNIDCSYTTPPPTTTAQHDEVYVTTMAPYHPVTTPAPPQPDIKPGTEPDATPSSAPWDLPNPDDLWLDSKTPRPSIPGLLPREHAWAATANTIVHSHLPAVGIYALLPVSCAVLCTLVIAFHQAPPHARSRLAPVRVGRQRLMQRPGSLF